MYFEQRRVNMNDSQRQVTNQKLHVTQIVRGNDDNIADDFFSDFAESNNSKEIKK